jgi:hypothetical protein
METIDQMMVQFDKSLEFELHSGFCQCGFGYNPSGNAGTVNCLKEAVQFALIRTFDEIDQKTKEQMKGEFSLTGKSLGRIFMFIDKIFG